MRKLARLGLAALAGDARTEHGHGHGEHGNPDDLEGYIARMEEPGRDAWQKPDEVIVALRVGRGDVVGDIGAGPGYFALRLAAAAAPVFAVDVEPRILEVLRARVERRGARNVTPVLGLPADPLVPEGACDLITLVDTYHHFPDGPAYLARLARSLRTGGRLVNLDFEKRPTPVGPPVERCVARDDFVADAARAGLRVVDEPKLLPHQYFIVLAP
jgi:SAM-dependent methyltransferase